MSDNKTTAFSFDDVNENIILNRDDFQDNDKLQFRKNEDGEILKSIEQNITDDNGVTTTIKTTLGFITMNDMPCTMKLSPSTMKNLRIISQNKVDNLLNKTFIVTIRGTDQYRYLLLRLE